MIPNKEKYRERAKLIKNIFSWGINICIVGILLSLIGLAIFLFIPNNHALFNYLNGGNIKLSMDGVISIDIKNIIVSSNNIKYIMCYIFSASIICFSIYYLILKNIHKILTSVEDGKPFTYENVKYLYSTGKYLIIGSVAVGFTEYFIALTIVHRLEIHNINVNFAINIYMFITGILVIVLGNVFEYGVYLQNEYDDTI